MINKRPCDEPNHRKPERPTLPKSESMHHPLNLCMPPKVDTYTPSAAQGQRYTAERPPEEPQRSEITSWTPITGCERRIYPSLYLQPS